MPAARSGWHRSFVLIEPGSAAERIRRRRRFREARKLDLHETHLWGTPGRSEEWNIVASRLNVG